MPDGDLHPDNELHPDGDLHDEIARTEAEIEELAETLARCRKFAIAGKVAFAIGALWLAAVFFGAVGSGAGMLFAAFTGVVGGIVVSGSNAGTAEQVGAALREAEARRAELIGMIELRLVDGGGDSFLSLARGIRNPSAS